MMSGAGPCFARMAGEFLFNVCKMHESLFWEVGVLTLIGHSRD